MRKGYKFDAIHGQMLKDNARMTMFARPTTDILYEADYVHVGGDCSNCDPQRRIPMEPRNESVVHFGLIGSGNRVIANAILRDKLHGSESIICFEMEAAGLMKDFECLVIRGICGESIHSLKLRQTLFIGRDCIDSVYNSWEWWEHP